MRQTLIIMVKTPRPGKVKTRLADDIGTIAATWWFRHQVRNLIRRLRDPRWRIVLAVAPDAQGMTSRFFPPDLPRIPQGRGDIGQRMARALRQFPNGPTCLIGGDIPGVQPTHIARAFQTVRCHDIVFGAAVDGGFWLVASRCGHAIPRSMFTQIRWSSPHALDDSIALLNRARTALVDQLADVDTGADLRAYRNLHDAGD